MNKDLVIYASLALAVIIGGFVIFSSNEDYESQYNSLKESGKIEQAIKKEGGEVAVEYQKKEASAPSQNQSKSQSSSPSKPKKEKFVESKTVDENKQFEIALINKQTWDESKTGGTFAALSGTIDNNKFMLRIPEYLIKEKVDLELSLKNLKTGESKTISAPFIRDMTVLGASNKISINSSDASNYSFERKKGILPIPDGDSPPSLPAN